jgi:hypothetical protein
MPVSKSRFTRRDFLSSTTGLAASVCLAGRAAGKVRVGTPRVIPDNYGDTWALAWGDDDSLYTPANDTTGFRLPERISRVLPRLTDEQERLLGEDYLAFKRTLPDDQKKQITDAHEFFSTIAFHRLEGSGPHMLRGTTVNFMTDFVAQDRRREFVEPRSGQKWPLGPDGCTWKSSGCASIDGALYLVVARHMYGEFAGDPRRRQTAASASILKSVDFGRSWSRSSEEALASPMFPGSHFATPYFIDYGKGRSAVDGADQYVYAISNNGFWDNGDAMVLGRVRRAHIGRLEGSDWEFFAGGDGADSSSWTRNPLRAVSVLKNPGKLGMTGAAYLRARQRYLMIGWYYPAGSGKFDDHASTHTVWDFYEAEKPWGPWRCLDSHSWQPQGYYCPLVCPKFQSADRVHVYTAGDFKNWKDYYRLTVVPTDLA